MGLTFPTVDAMVSDVWCVRVRGGREREKGGKQERGCPRWMYGFILPRRWQAGRSRDNGGRKWSWSGQFACDACGTGPRFRHAAAPPPLPLPRRPPKAKKRWGCRVKAGNGCLDCSLSRSRRLDSPSANSRHLRSSPRNISAPLSGLGSSSSSAAGSRWMELSYRPWKSAERRAGVSGTFVSIL